MTFTTPGTCLIDANQAGAGRYAPAPPASQPVTVDLAPSFVQDTPHLSAGAGQPYGYVFTASGAPAVSYALAKGPSWLTIEPTDGVVSGTPPAGTKAFTYSVTASNAIGTATAGPFRVSVLAAVAGKDLGVKLTCPATVTVASVGTRTVTATNHAASAVQLVSLTLTLPTPPPWIPTWPTTSPSPPSPPAPDQPKSRPAPRSSQPSPAKTGKNNQVLLEY